MPSLIAQMLEIALDAGVRSGPTHRSRNCIVEDGRVVGVRVDPRRSIAPSIKARQGVLLSAGGFAHNRGDARRVSAATSPTSAKWSMANPGDTGEAMQTAMGLGAKTDLMDEAWWLPSPRTGRFGQSTLDQARQRPRTIYVDAAGKRFVNESNSYMEVGKAMYERNKTSRAVPCWLIFDDRYRKRYAHVRSRPGWFPKEMLESGRLKQALRRWTSSPSCAASTPPASPRPSSASTTTPTGAWIRSTAAASRRTTGRSATRTARCTPCLGPIDEPPYYAVEVVPGDIGTCGGLVTDEHAQVLDERRPADRGSVRHRQHHGHGHGPALPRPRREHRQQHGLRLRGGTPRRRVRCKAT